MPAVSYATDAEMATALADLERSAVIGAGDRVAWDDTAKQVVLPGHAWCRSTSRR
jgi:hypothetical protein